MKSTSFAALLIAALAMPLFALDGAPGIHDPSSVALCDGKYYSFGTGGNGIMSDDGWTWRGGAVRPNGGVAPDVCKIGDRWLVSYGGVSTMWTKTLDPNSPDFGFSTPIQIARGDGSEFNCIDSSLLLDPNDGKLWMTIGSYVGYIRLYELDPKTGGKLNDQFTTLAINCEASEMIFHDGWYYLFGTKASCCAGTSSGYNTRVGRAKSPKGPFMDNMGNDMIQGGGKLFAASSGRGIGVGHFGLLDLGDGVQKWSCHYEADLDRGGQSVLDIRPLVFKDGWPVAGSNILKETTYQISIGPGDGSLKTGVGTRVIGALVPKGEAAGKGEFVITPVANVGGYPGMPFCKITMGDKVLAINADKEVVTAAAFTSAPEQLWRLDQLIDGTWRIVPKTLSDAKNAMALTANGTGTTTLAKYEFKNDGQHWAFTPPGDPKVLKEGNYEIESARSGRALEIAVEGVPVGRGGAPAAGGGAGRGAGGGAGRGAGGGGLGRGGGAPIPDQDAAQVSANWPTGNIDTRLANYVCQAQQKWTIQPVADAAGYYKILIAGTTRALTATADREVATVPTFTGAPEQLWRLDKLDDGNWRIKPKATPGAQEELSLTTIGTGLGTLSKLDSTTDRQHFNIKAP